MTKPGSGTFAARYERGIVLRRKTPREKHADLAPAKRDPVAILAAGDRTRVPELVPERYRRMLVSPFTFLRGAAAVMAQDLKHEPSAGIPLQACGDCHLMNFGAFDTPEELILFDINDFDETLPGVDFTVDLKRLAASVAVAALDAKFSSKRARAAAATTVAAYRARMRVLAKLSPLEIWHSRIELAREIKRIEDRTLRSQLHAIIAKAGKTARTGRQLPAPGQGQQDRRQAADDLSFQAQGRCEAPRRCRRRVRILRQAPAAGTAVPARAIRAQGHRLQGRRGRQRRHVLRHQPVHRRRRLAAVPSVQGSRTIRARMPRAEIRRAPRPARRRGAADHAGGERHLPRLDRRRGVRPALLRAPPEEPAARLDRRDRRGECARELRPPVRAHPRPRPCALGRSGGDRGIHGKERGLRRCAGVFRDGLCGSHASRTTTCWRRRRAAPRRKHDGGSSPAAAKHTRFAPGGAERVLHASGVRLSYGSLECSWNP